MENNMYRMGDYVYIESSPTYPYQIRKIEELNKSPSGNVEAKVVCFYRRRDISSSLIMLTDNGNNLDDDEEETDVGSDNDTIVTQGGEPLTNSEKHQLRHRELFISRDRETISATHIHGKCTVTLLHETESLISFLNNEDTFFYSLVYDSEQNTLLANKREMRVGSRYQADITPLLKEGEIDNRVLEDLEKLTWTPNHGLTDHQIDQFLVMSRTVGTFARALDCSQSSVTQPSLHMSASAASRDVTLFHSMDTLHNYKYDISKAVCSLIPSTGPVLCRDQMEGWSESEAHLFEQALEKYGKNFIDIRKDFLPWKTMENIIEYYYMWKTPDRNVHHKRVKAVEAESKLKQVYLPNSNKSNPAELSNDKSGGMVNGNDSEVSVAICESCTSSTSNQWYAWGPPHMHCCLCSNCWQYWKKYGGLKLPSRIGREEKHSQESDVSNRIHLCKSRAGVMVYTSLKVRIMRRLCQDLIQPRKACRNPTWPINTAIIKQESIARIDGQSLEDLSYLVRRYTGKRYGRIADVLLRLGQKEVAHPQWMLTTEPHT